MEEVKRLTSDRVEARRSTRPGCMATSAALWMASVRPPAREQTCARAALCHSRIGDGEVIREARTVRHTCCIARSRTSDSGPHSLPRKIVSCAQMSFFVC